MDASDVPPVDEGEDTLAHSMPYEFNAEPSCEATTGPAAEGDDGVGKGTADDPEAKGGIPVPWSLAVLLCLRFAVVAVRLDLVGDVDPDGRGDPPWLGDDEVKSDMDNGGRIEKIWGRALPPCPSDFPGIVYVSKGSGMDSMSGSSWGSDLRLQKLCQNARSERD